MLIIRTTIRGCVLQPSKDNLYNMTQVSTMRACAVLLMGVAHS